MPSDMDVKMLIYAYVPDTHKQVVVRGSEDGLVAVKVLPYSSASTPKSNTSSRAGTPEIDLVCSYRVCQLDRSVNTTKRLGTARDPGH